MIIAGRLCLKKGFIFPCNYIFKKTLVVSSSLASSTFQCGIVIVFFRKIENSISKKPKKRKKKKRKEKTHPRINK
jgi:hypothetical protein